ncbi:MAG: UDP-2,3-diacylglucosamine diphosphatase LpxI [Desulfobacterales bacterium]|jgi:UDP-2,3-diacylglucosamine hydrolase|nr:UDP-2,3-diacylglucosamine diphosphatase LpxI [Desulfobacteraceae bacterium]MBT4364406.1 UDP-2,3-diacylglucosamine diphosphatase LpxI [Desulfobacteraceae bacterium]MBT7085699.1 UDP-2,3-diacylglucosamine diphosphatase LpxI [Desulfobacterales bacterium]MBT7696234.1 UDP-2,3-diacylglucosamine diphosphatase LpxI [Desulfobacterales bacterium]
MKIGLIAGGGQFPIIFSNIAKSKGYEVFAVAHIKETDPALENHVDMIRWIHLGQVKKLLNFFKENKVTEVAMLGKIKKTRIFSDFKPDTKALKLIAGMRHTHDDNVLRGLAGALEKEGIKVRSSTFLIPDILATEGCWTKRKPSRAEKEDMKLGWEIAKEIGKLDIGQCIVLCKGSVLAVEAIDGTDATIKRGGSLANNSAVVVKVAKPNQDLRFDVPAVGVETIMTMQEAGAGLLVLEAGKAVVFDKEEMIDCADRYGISIIALENEN